MGILKRHIVSDDFVSTRLYDYAPLIFAEIVSRKGIKKAIKRGEIRVNGKISCDGYWVKPGDILERIEGAVTLLSLMIFRLLSFLRMTKWQLLTNLPVLIQAATITEQCKMR